MEELKQAFRELESTVRLHWCRDFRHDGLCFKPDYHYLTNEGFPLGTECFFMNCEADGSRKVIAAESAIATVKAATQWFKQKIQERKRALATKYAG